MNCELILVTLVVLAVFAVLFLNRGKEAFQDNNNNTLGNVHPDVSIKRYLRNLIDSSDNDNNNTNEGNNNALEKLSRSLRNGSDFNKNDYVKKTNINMAARAAAREYCPVASDYDPSHYILKTEIPEIAKCPKMPDLKDFVLKSTIPPATKCPSCVCPKVKVSAGLCKKCPSPEDVCPKPKACGVEQCKNIIKCPETKPCPTQPPCVCPPVKVNQKPLKCPPPAACPVPPPCPRVERCSPQACPRCKFYGVKSLPQKSLSEQIKELIDSDDSLREEKINTLRELLGVHAPTCPVHTTEAFRTTNAEPTVPSPTSAADLSVTTASIESVVANSPVVDYNNKCEDNSLLYSAVGVLGSEFN